MALDSTPLIRKARLALELVDPITGLIVSQGVKVEARKADGSPSGIAPVVSWSGRFVWLERDPPVPEIARIACDPGPLPYEPETIDLAGVPQGEKLVTRRLRPNAAYGVPQGVTAIRGRLFEIRDNKRQGIANAIVQIAWSLSQPAEWIPPRPATMANLRIGDALTNAKGDFLAFSRPPKRRSRYSDYVGYPKPGEQGFRDAPITPDSKDGVAKARLQVTRLDINEGRSTPDNFNFLGTLPAGRIAEGQMLPRDLELDWNNNLN